MTEPAAPITPPLPRDAMSVLLLPVLLPHAGDEQ
jgi:hypothetical protein